jgi:diguanylate cyclase (GGDEF)-like protein
MPNQPPQPITAHRIFLMLAAGFLILLSGIAGLLAVDQHRAMVSADQLRAQTVPEIIRLQRLARNLDHLRHEGERIFSAATPEGRQQALYLVMLVASHPGIQEHAQASEIARTTERFLAETVRGAVMDPGEIAARQGEWTTVASRLGLLVDDISVESANLAANDLAQITETLRIARYKLAAALLLVIAFLAGTIQQLRRHLIQPLERIDAALSSLDVSQPPPDFPPTQLPEIHAVEAAVRRLHASLVSNEAARRELEELANRDGLTGLLNRRHFMLCAEGELRRAERYGRPVAVALADLDFFKNLNDTHGHGAGDLVLRTFAAMMLESVRGSDLVCRYGGEEFAFLFPESGVEQSEALVERFRHRFALEPIRLQDGTEVRVTVSIGLADASGRPLEVALRQADQALYVAKRGGRNRVVVAGSAECTS